MFPENLYFIGGDLHIYKNHLEQVKEQLGREPYRFPSIEIRHSLDSLKELETIEYTDIRLLDYLCHPALPAPIAV